MTPEKPQIVAAPTVQKSEKEIFVEKFSDAKKVSLETKVGKFEGFHIDMTAMQNDTKKDLFEILAPVATNAFGRDGDEKFKEECFQYLCENDHILIIFEGDKLVAYRQWGILNSDFGEIVYLGGAFIHRDFQGKGLATKMIDYVNISANETNPNWKYLAVVTQNAIIQKTFNSFAARQGGGDLYQFGDTNIPEDIQHVVQVVAKSDKDDKLDPKTLLSKGSYGKTLYAGQAEVDKINQNTSLQSLNVQAGDAVYSVWRK